MKFRVSLAGENFLVAFDPTPPRKHGFYATAHVEAQTEEEAETVALDLVRASTRLRPLVQNSADDRPRLSAEKIARVVEWPSDVARPLTGLTWYEEEKPNKAPEPTRTSVLSFRKITWTSNIDSRVAHL